jgi:hypothetical protein
MYKDHGDWWVWLYDPNGRDDNDPHLIINTNTDQYRYTYSYVFGGDGLGINRLSGHTRGQRERLGLAGPGRCELRLTGGGHLLACDSQGRCIGYQGDQLVQEIPGAEAFFMPGGLALPTEPIYALPLSETYSIALDGQTLTQTASSTVSQFGPGYALSVSEVQLAPNVQDHLAFASDGSGFSYTAGNSKEVNFTLARDTPETNCGFYIIGFDTSAGQAVGLSDDPGTGRLTLNNAQGASGSYDLEIVRINTTGGGRKFVHSNTAVPAGDTQYMQYGSWDGSGPMTMLVDRGSDGSVDETAILENQRVQALAGGWDLISLPLAPTSTALTETLASIAGRYDQVYAYDATDLKDPWKLYDVARPSFLNDLTQIDERMGIWVHTSEPLTLTVSGRALFSTTIPLVEGWNLVGYPGQSTRPVTEALATIAGKYSLVQTYDATESRWLTYDVSAPPFLNDLTEMTPGKGYWLVVTEDCVWNVE